MVYVLLIISLILNVSFIFKTKKLKKMLEELYCSDEELDDMLDRLWLCEKY